MGLFNLLKPAKTVLVIDAVSLNESLGMKGKVPPRNQLQMLRRLARFSQREKIEVVAVLSGTPLNKAAAGKKFEGVMVLYSKSLEVHAKHIAKIAAGRGAGAVLVSSNAATEKMAGRGVKKLRISTFRKAFDVGGDSEGESPRSRSNSNSNRPPRRRQQKQSGGKGNATEPKKERPVKENSEADAINELIDLVD
ncbi:MAG: hypothetical protein V3V05_12345 [Pontiella sp.]